MPKDNPNLKLDLEPNFDLYRPGNSKDERQLKISQAEERARLRKMGIYPTITGQYQQITP